MALEKSLSQIFRDRISKDRESTNRYILSIKKTFILNISLSPRLFLCPFSSPLPRKWKRCSTIPTSASLSEGNYFCRRARKQFVIIKRFRGWQHPSWSATITLLTPHYCWQLFYLPCSLSPIGVSISACISPTIRWKRCH